MKVIAHQELTSSAASITFSNIPQTGYTDLVLVVSPRSSHSGSVADIRVAFNGSTANQTIRRLLGTGSSATSDSQTTDGLIGDASGSTANTFSNFAYYFPNYTSSNAKSYTGDGVAENNATLGYQTIIAGLWNQTAAITSLTLSYSAGNFLQYSSATLFGVLAGSDGTTTVS